ncbi:hypothetical protein GOP47_0019503 [Adiantum capillus-veneris]|uniref:Uncharacterized protein n=1 Tax=Adiantum capillus-veneris TaxID=13818 RepID=A0A9D4Z745_ADICA|nr:hypothetical protein GOP47_0019503 [Adiantum capillus-veneris]
MASASACRSCPYCKLRKSSAIHVLLMVMVMILVCDGSSTTANAENSLCPLEDLGFLPVYPYWSLCINPAVYETEGYMLQGLGGSGGGYLAPEWDESNSTYYVRLSEEGATYVLTNPSDDIRNFVAQAQDVYFTNSNSGRVLSWRQEGDEYFLVEVDVDDQYSAFQFLASTYSLPCPAILTARCVAYYVASYSDSSLGLSYYEEDGATYFKKGQDLSSIGMVHLGGRNVNKNNNIDIASVV